jgi:hypothetical protein
MGLGVFDVVLVKMVVLLMVFPALELPVGLL